ncbi:MAG: ArgE/DapE family deacylase [Firmicutes bacterium]|nr:ArgE/DapE family deacylase [Bacillota bacterium]
MWQVDEEEARKLLAGLISIDSENPSLVPGGAGEEAVARFILDYLIELGLVARLDEVAPGRPNVVGVLPAAESPSGVPPALSPFGAKHGLILNGHTDTVATAGMTWPPLEPRFEGDRVHGRGAFDMKGGVAMALLALAAVKRSGTRLRRSVLFTGVMDEEYASLGTQDVVRRYRADAAVVMEPTGLEIHLAHKGFAWVAVETFGRAAHGSRHEEGVDAITRMGRVLVEAEKLGRHFLEEPGHPLCGKRSIHASIIQGGRELSTYPERCTAQFERRTLPGEDPAVVAEELEAICRNLAAEDPSFRARVTLGLTRSGYEVDRDERVVRALAEAYQAVVGKEPAYGGSAPWLDSALLGAAGIPTVIFGPSGAGAHSAEEYVTVSSVVQGATILAEAIIHICGA